MRKSLPLSDTQTSLCCPHCRHAGPHHSKGWRHCKTCPSVLRKTCCSCKRSFSERTNTIMHGLRSTESQVISAIHARTEGVGLRAAGRLVRKTHATVASWEAKMRAFGEQLDCRVPADYNVILESDELYTKVNSNRPAWQSTGWTACAVERRSRYCTKHVTGNREEKLFDEHIDVLLKFVGTANAHLVSDGERWYASCLWKHAEARVTLSGEKNSKRGRPKGSSSCLRKGMVLQRKVKGSQNRNSNRGRHEAPLPHHPQSSLLEETDVHANHTEAYNASLRRRCSSFRRRTNMYAKDNKGLERALGAQRVIYNWVRPHFYHGKTPGQVIEGGKAMTFESIVRVQIAA